MPELRSLLLLLSVSLGACAPAAATECFDVPAPAELRGGGWDANGRSLGGGGGWDYNGRTLGAGLEALELLDATLDHGALLDPAGAPIVRGRVTLRAASSGTRTLLDARFVRLERGVPLYEIASEGVSLCPSLAAIVPGSWAPSGDHASGGGVTVACVEGAIAKCALWGYAPWSVGEREHAACTRMVRADYCGDAASWTRDGTPIDVTDVEQVQTLAGGMRFEAGWDEGGAVCVRETRWDVSHVGGAAVLPPCWASLPRCDDVAGAFAAGALVASETLHTPITRCR